MARHARAGQPPHPLLRRPSPPGASQLRREDRGSRARRATRCGDPTRRRDPWDRARVDPAVGGGRLQPPAESPVDYGRETGGSSGGRPEDAEAEEAGSASETRFATGPSDIRRFGSWTFVGSGSGAGTRWQAPPFRRRDPGQGFHSYAPPLRWVQRDGRYLGEPDVVGHRDGPARLGGLRAHCFGSQRRGHGEADHRPAQRARCTGADNVLPSDSGVPDGGEYVQYREAVREGPVRYAPAAT